MNTGTPSSSVANSCSSTIRRRSNTPSPHLHPGTQTRPSDHGASSSVFSPTLTLQVEDTDALDIGPTVLLVQKRHGLGISAVTGMPDRDMSMVLPFASRQFRRVPRPPAESAANATPLQIERDAEVPTTPVTDLVVPPLVGHASPSGSSTISGSWSLVSMLPVAANLLSPQPSRLSLLPRYGTLSRTSSPIPSPIVATPSSTESPRQHSPTDPSTQPPSPPPVRPTLIPSLSTADKLTRKFPVHRRSMRNISLAAMQRTTKGKGGAAFAGTLLGEGEGLGLDWPDRWTKHKWCLLLSLCTLFLYGLGMLVFAVLTWFQSKWVSSTCGARTEWCPLQHGCTPT